MAKLTLKNYNFIAKNGEWITDSYIAIKKQYSPDLCKYQFLIDEDIDACYESNDCKNFVKKDEIPKIEKLIPVTFDDCDLLVDTKLIQKNKKNNICILVSKNNEYSIGLDEKYKNIIDAHNLSMYQNGTTRPIILVDFKKNNEIVGIVMPIINLRDVEEYLKY